ncbi:hypothetical protein AB1Y20_016948 [Prymnesium parvum]|uniref:Autophagy-related protein 9 n=1 Tax=Prymnesium parvum TaxID=97485 RepID=A0AB34IBD2_PRYPA
MAKCHIYSVVLGFTLVIRLQISYQRLWEGTTHCHTAASKWADACMQIVAFDEASKDAFSETAFEFRMLMIHYTSLMNACALIDMRADDLVMPGVMPVKLEDPYLFRPNTTVAIVPLASQQSKGKAPEGAGESIAGRMARPANSDGHEFKTCSKRASSVPLQLVLRQRKQMQERLHEDFNSFEAISANENLVVPTSYDSMRRRRERWWGVLVGWGGKAKEWVENSLPRASSAISQLSSKMHGKSGLSRDMSRLRAQRNGSMKKEQGSMSIFSYLSATVFRTANEEVKLELLAGNAFEVVGGVTEAELALLSPIPPSSRAFRVQTWMVRMMTNRLGAGGLAIPPPLLSRTYQVLSDGTAAAMQGRKVAHVEFPFALRQLLAVMITVFLGLAPICIGAFIDSYQLVAFLSLCTCVGYTALNEAARELEMPFGLDANDLNLTAYQRDFNEKLAQLLDQTVPELGYIALVNRANSEEAIESTNAVKENHDRESTRFQGEVSTDAHAQLDLSNPYCV